MRRLTGIDLGTGGLRSRPDDIAEGSPDTFVDRDVHGGDRHIRFDPIDA